MKRNRTLQLRPFATRGFTLIELMLALGVAAVIISIAAPNMRTFILNNRLSATANEMLRSIQTARSEAAKRQQNVVVCMTADPTATTPACVTSGYGAWIVFEDTNKNQSHDTGETTLETHTFEPDKVKLLANNGNFIGYASTGFRILDGSTAATKNITSIVVCDSRGIKDVSGGTTGLSLARGIYISPTGRSRITREVTNTTSMQGVTQLYANTGGTC